ncbi:hypothetical protein ACFFX1_33760 [Dactylosporangium sucinum]|uniref:Uncharacterized protein n=1 Tax=Dactylosporangium sucinum TaxID=1424081 RepID=A0A917UDT8_9ACTN|nr:hypothetical protein [Dactylosporangium sucinum]GGM86010.1 hypothetical protein GCM10007977_104850 [Dactylosporangium sucinum]
MRSFPDILLISTLPGLVDAPSRETVHRPDGVLTLGTIASVPVAVAATAAAGARWVISVALAPAAHPTRRGDVIVPTDAADPALLRLAREVPEGDWLPEHYAPVAHFDTCRVLGVPPSPAGVSLTVYGVCPPGLSPAARADAGDAAVSFARAVVAHLAP